MEYYLTKDCGLEVKDVDAKKGIVEGYLSAFGNIDSDEDMVLPGAFKKTILENGPNSPKPRIKHLRDHWDTVGVFQELEEDSYGLRYVSKLGRSRLAKDTLMDYEDGIITEHSIGFNIIKSNDQGEYREITEVKLWEGSSLTKWGANEDTPVTGVKDISSKEGALKMLDTITKRLRNGRYSDDYLELMEIQLKQVQQYLALDEPEEKKSTIEPEDDSKLLDSFINNLKCIK